MRILLFVVALVAGGVAFWLWLGQATLVMMPTAQSPAVPSLQILVAARDLAPETVLAEGDVTWAPAPDSDLAPGMLVQNLVPDADRHVIGVTLQSAVAAGSPILETAVQGAVTLSLADMVAKDKRAYAIVVSDASAAGGLVQPGDHIDLIQTRAAQDGPTAMVVASDLLVLAVDQRLTPTANATPARTLTLELSSDDVGKISVASATGGLSVALRGNRP